MKNDKNKQIKNKTDAELPYNEGLFITSGFPTKGNPAYTFLETLVCAMSDIGLEAKVVYPISVTHFIVHRLRIPPREWEKKTPRGNSITVYCPRIITLSSGGRFREFRNKVNFWWFGRGVRKEIHRRKLEPDFVYGHFLEPAGFVSAQVGKTEEIPSCFAYGENTSYTVDTFGLERSRKMIADITAVISVATDNTKYLSETKLVPDEIVKTIPNGVDSRIFYPREKTLMRKKYSISEESFVVAFVGYFSEIKGSARLSAAIEKAGDDIHSIFIGSGELAPKCKNIDFIGSIQHDDIPELLSAADVFVLPTIAEGCCNAIIEAMACGLPIISSNLPFNDDILDESCSIRIDTTDIDAIAQAILDLKNDVQRRKKMSENSIIKSQKLDVCVRARRILNWIKECSDGEQIY